jgi:signal transduction histidine kinase
MTNKLCLIANAKEASNEGSTIRIEVEYQGQWILCHVSDSGHGIPKEAQDKIFDLVSKAGHSGFGLYLVARSLRENNADIFLSSSSSRGTRFTLRLPKYQNASRT